MSCIEGTFWSFKDEELCMPPMQQVLPDKHYLRKHGKNAYYGQGKM